MPSDEEILFGKIAMREGFISAPQLRRALKVQEDSPFPRPLGAILVDQQVISLEQLGRILEIQQKNLQAPAQGQPNAKKEDAIFGYLAVKRGFSTQKQVDECLRIQEMRESEGRIQRLGEILVELGYLTPAQVERVLETQRKKILSCAKCSTQYNVDGYEAGKRFRCKKCGAELIVPSEVKDVVVEAEIEAVPVEVTGDQQKDLDRAFEESAIIGGRELEAILRRSKTPATPPVPAAAAGFDSDSATMPMLPPEEVKAAKARATAARIELPTTPTSVLLATAQADGPPGVSCAVWAQPHGLLVGTAAGCLLYHPGADQPPRRLSMPRGRVDSISWDPALGQAAVVIGGKCYLYDLARHAVAGVIGLDKTGRLGEVEG